MNQNRRSFLATLGALVAAPFVPKPAPTPGTWGAVTRSTVPFFRAVTYQGRPFIVDPLMAPGMLFGLDTSEWVRFEPVTLFEPSDSALIDHESSVGGGPT